MSEKYKAVPLVRNPKQIETVTAELQKQAEKVEAAEEALRVQTAARRTAQIANLLISGHTFESIAAQTGGTAEEVEALLNADSTRYIRSQPALRQWVRRWASGKYSELLEAVWDQAVDPKHRDQLAYQDRARPLVERITKLHGAEAPVQSEVKVDAAPESVQKIVDAIAASQGLGYDVDIFDIVDAELVHDAVAESAEAVDEAAQAVDADETGGLL